MAKYSEELRKKAAELVEIEFFSVSQVCKALGISRQAFYTWMDEKSDFKKSMVRAMNLKNETLLSMAYSSIKKRLEGGMIEEEKDIYVPDENNPAKLLFKSRTIRRKECLPDLHTIKMILNRNDRLLQSDLNLHKQE